MGQGTLEDDEVCLLMMWAQYSYKDNVSLPQILQVIIFICEFKREFVIN